MKRLLVLTTFLLFSHSFFAQTYLGEQRDIDQILDNISKFSEYVVASDYDKIAASYTKDGKIFPNRRKIIGGTADIRAYWVQPEGVRTVAHKITPVEIKVRGREAYDYGYYEGTTRRANGEEVSWRGKYVIVWRKVGKKWKIYLDIWNSVDD